VVSPLAKLPLFLYVIGRFQILRARFALYVVVDRYACGEVQ